LPRRIGNRTDVRERRAGELGEAALGFQVPSDASLVGASVYWQALVGAPRALTNFERTTFSGY
jgi:hypothetical protein